MVMRRVASCASVAALLLAQEARALIVPLTRADMPRALRLARWVSSDTDRARFHARYDAPVSATTIEYLTLQRVEVITEFRRLELVAEAHERVDDGFGRGGLDEVVEAMRPWRGRLSIVAHLAVGATMAYITGVPPVDVTVDPDHPLAPLDLRRTPIYGHNSMTGLEVEAVFDPVRIGQTRRIVDVTWGQRRFARVAIDFSAID